MAEKHEGTYEDRGWMLDGWSCSCGWKSHPYFDGMEYAEAEWKKHVKSFNADQGVPPCKE